MSKRIYFKSAVYHVTIRGNNRQNILRDEVDKTSFIKSLAKFKARFAFKLYGFVVMDNHVHLVIQADQYITISKIMQAITLSYSVKFRKRYSYCGYVWQGRFRSTVIAEDRYIIECINYIHNNPIRAGIVGKAEDYSWSSVHYYNSSRNGIKELIDIDAIQL